jgi:ABC-2 type transport system permease protein
VVPDVPSLATQVTSLARRSVVGTLRQPLIVAPTLLFPLFFLAVTAPALENSTSLKGFPTDNYLSFALAMPFVQAGLASVSVAGGALAQDIRTGFLSRLSLTRLQGAALVIGNLAGTVLLAIIGGIAYLAIGLAFGAEVEAGPGGGAFLVFLSILYAVAFGCLGVLVALRTGDAESVQALFPLLFALFFLSSMAMPRNLIETGWFKAIATYNPMSYLIEGVRSVLISGWDTEALLLGCGIAVAMIVVGLWAASRQLGSRLTRT